MAIKLENVGIAVRDLEATIAFFTDLGLSVVGRNTNSSNTFIPQRSSRIRCIRTRSVCTASHSR